LIETIQGCNVRDMELITKAFISVLEQKHEYTHEHSEEVGLSARLLAQQLSELSEEDRLCIFYAGKLHDIGKIGVEERTLNNPSKTLTGAQIQELEAHTFKGVQILRKCGVPFPELVIEGVFFHHECFDGKKGDLMGYPLGISGENIPIAGRIVAVADSYNAMISTQRAYSRPLSRDEAIATLRGLAGNHLDPRLVEIFIEKVIPEISKS
jgi:putative nucleotidyltransferase with HDIG domain